ncbi:MAG: T9SS type A sorting domain-containing protein [Candidatus Latescibacteria bacterium]|nr:T9SS type A sorting domain-containing protein [Candidatus Latescibacterota bacterium]
MITFFRSLACLLLLGLQPVLAQPAFHCAGHTFAPGSGQTDRAAKRAQALTTGSRRVLVIFAHFADESFALPAWRTDLFNAARPGSFTHFYDTMSFGQLHVEGQVAPQVYRASGRPESYLSDDPTELGDYGRFSKEILRQADANIDFSAYDNDGPDGIPNSGDDDGIVDALFIILDAIPANFILGNANGIASLDLGGDYLADDAGANGQPIRIVSDQGILGQGSNYNQTVGIMCHEYGHVLGLPDLFNTEFLRTKNPGGPENDSAGIGNWGLMGWGTLGWQRNDGPTSFSAWSRLQLGWAQLAQPRATEDTLELEDVGRRGALYQIPLARREFFLLEYRRRQSSYYDRNMPGQGLLVWHARFTHSTATFPELDLECADGLWQDGGYPLGSEADPVGGRDNLDFWAHDEAYRTAHGGNLGDATDLFDGRLYRAFTPQTNPAALSASGLQYARIENIRLDGGLARADIHFFPLQVELDRLILTDEDGDRSFLPHEEIQISFEVENTGAAPVPDLQVHLSTDDPHVDLATDSLALGPLPAGERIALPTNQLAFHFKEDFAGIHEAAFTLEFRDQGRVLAREQFTAKGQSLAQRIVEIALIDSAGNSDGLPQAGEPIHIRLELDVSAAPILGAFDFALRPVDADILVNTRTEMRSSADRDGQLHYISSQEFFLPASLGPGARLDFAFSVSSLFSTWRDTVSLSIAAGGDRTPPRLGFLRTSGGTIPEFVLPADRALDGGPLPLVEAVITPVLDTTAVVRVPLNWDGDAYRGRWTEAVPGRYWLLPAAEDQAGNRGLGLLGSFTVSGRDDGRDNTPPGFASGRADGLVDWEGLGPRHNDWLEAMLDLTIAPADPRVAYLLTTQGLWRSLDRLQTWTQVGLMTGGQAATAPGQVQIAVDAKDPATLYFKRRCTTPQCASVFAQSRDGGATWQRLPTPNQGVDEDLLAVDPRHAGRLHLLSEGSLWVSDDGGLGWARSQVVLGESPALGLDEVRVLPHPGHDDLVYAASANASDFWDKLFWRSTDGGYTWENWAPDGGFELSTLALDPRDSAILYSTLSVASSITTNKDSGRGFWRESFTGDLDVLLADPLGHLFGWSAVGLWRFAEDGTMYTPGMRIELPFGDPGKSTASVREIAFARGEPSVFYVVPASPAQHLWVSLDDGRAWQEVLVERGIPPVHSLWLGPDGALTAATGRSTSDGRQQPALFVRDSEADSWQQQPLEIAVDNGIFEAFYRDPQAPEFALSYVDDRLYWSTDGGVQWRQILHLPDSSRPDFLADPQQPGVYYIGSRQLYRSSDFGTTWAEIGAGLPESQGDAFALDPDHPGALFALAAGQLWHSQDNGSGWNLLGSVAEDDSLQSLATAPRDGGSLYVAGQRRLYRSQDRGSTWDVVLDAGLHPWERPLLRFAPNDSETIYMATGRRLFLSRDRGLNWRPLNGSEITGWPWINDILIDPTNPAYLYAATSQGVYRIDSRAEATAVGENRTDTPAAFTLAANYPNPFNSQTAIRFGLPFKSQVLLSVYNSAGQKLIDLVDAELAAGPHSIHWNGRDEAGGDLASGVYLYRLQSGGNSATRKLLLLR